MKRSIFLVFIIMLSFAAASAQNSGLTLDEGVKAHKGIDAIYKTFGDGYRELKPELVADLYTEDAAYLSPNAAVMTGRAAILENFTGFFNNVRENGRNMAISFRILQRRVEKNLGYDVGIYTLTSYKDGKQLGEPNQGKFVVVAVKEKDGKWRFQVDGFSSLKPPARQN
jgi:uncharacterized protein (TIGR02246 family)